MKVDKSLFSHSFAKWCLETAKAPSRRGLSWNARMLLFLKHRHWKCSFMLGLQLCCVISLEEQIQDIHIEWFRQNPSFNLLVWKAIKKRGNLKSYTCKILHIYCILLCRVVTLHRKKDFLHGGLHRPPDTCQLQNVNFFHKGQDLYQLWKINIWDLAGMWTPLHVRPYFCF